MSIGSPQALYMLSALVLFACQPIDFEPFESGDTPGRSITLVGSGFEDTNSLWLEIQGVVAMTTAIDGQFEVLLPETLPIFQDQTFVVLSWNDIDGDGTCDANIDSVYQSDGRASETSTGWLISVERNQQLMTCAFF